MKYEEVVCPHCGSHKVYKRKDQPKLFRNVSQSIGKISANLTYTDTVFTKIMDNFL